MAREQMTIPMRDLLIEHIDGPVLLTAGHRSPMTEKWDNHLRSRLLLRADDIGWIEFDRKVSPMSTSLTDAGKMMLCAVLADWADAMTRAHYGLYRLLPDQPGKVAESKKLDESL